MGESHSGGGGEGYSVASLSGILQFLSHLSWVMWY